MTERLSLKEREEKRIFPLEFWDDALIRSVIEGFSDQIIDGVSEGISHRGYRSITRDTPDCDFANRGYTLRWRASVDINESNPNLRKINFSDADLGLKSTADLANRDEIEVAAVGKGSKYRRKLDRKSGGVITAIFNEARISSRDLIDVATFDTERVYFETETFVDANNQVSLEPKPGAKRVIIAVCLDTVEFLHNYGQPGYSDLNVIGARAEVELEVKRKPCRVEGSDLITDTTATHGQVEAAMTYCLGVLEKSVPAPIWQHVSVATESKATQAVRECQQHAEWLKAQRIRNAANGVKLVVARAA